MVGRVGEAPVREVLPVRELRLDDVDALLRLEDAAFPGDRLTRAEFRQAIRSAATVTLAADTSADGPAEPTDGPPGLAGYLFMQTRRGGRTARITSLAVDARQHGRGIGRRLVAEAEAEATRRGCDRIRLEVRADNPRAARLYQRMGYRHVGREDDFYDDGCAAEKYEKTLGG